MTQTIGSGSLVHGFLAQSARNATVQPWWNGNPKAEGSKERVGQLAADGMFIGGGAAAMAVAGKKLLALHNLRPGGLEMGFHGDFLKGLSGPKIALGALGIAGIVLAATGVRALFTSGGGPAPTPKPDPTPTPDPTPSPTPGPTPDPKPPTDPPKPPSFPPGPKTPTSPPGPKAPLPPANDPDQRPPVVTHTVKNGETLSFIASCFKVNWRDLYTLNKATIGSRPDAIQPGQKLEIPPAGYRGRDFSYTPTASAGHLPAGLKCDPISPKAQVAACTKIR